MEDEVPSASPVYDPHGTVQDALAVYFHAYGLGTGGYDQPYEIIKLFGFLPVILPNPPARKRALRCHDLNHVLGSYNALIGEGEIDIAGFEIGAVGGCRGFAVAWGINLVFFGFGILSRPRHLYRAFAKAQGAHNAYSLPSAEGDVLDRRLADLRAELQIPEVPKNPRAALPAFLMWSALALALLFSPLALLTWILL